MKRSELIKIIKEEANRVLKEQNTEATIPGAPEGITASWLHSQLIQIQQALSEDSPVFGQILSLVSAVAPEEGTPDEENAIRNADGKVSSFARKSSTNSTHFRPAGDRRRPEPGTNADGYTALKRDRE